MIKKLPPDFKAKWVAALRSGNYAQTNSALHDVKGFCCLGVACDIHNPGAWTFDRYEGSFVTPLSSMVWPALGDVPDEVMEVFYSRPVPLGPTVRSHLASMNDNGSSFAEIADWIEENL